MSIEWNTKQHSPQYCEIGELLAGEMPESKWDGSRYIYNPVDEKDIYYRTNYLSDEELNWINQRRVEKKRQSLPRLARHIEGFIQVNNQSEKIRHEKSQFVDLNYAAMIGEVETKLKGKFSIDNYIRAEHQEISF